jgi:predicted lysophospholipase L1 biosynthesis ABC-type transport system permease subunit
MKEKALRWAVTAQLGLSDARQRGRRNRRERPQAGEILSQLLLALGLVVLAAAIVAGITLWANGKLGDLTGN